MRVLFILHNINKSLGIEWLTEGLLKQNVSLAFILLNSSESEMERFLNTRRIPAVRLSYEKKLHAPLLVMQLCKAIKRFKPDVVHTHLRNADIYGQLAGYICGVKSRVYTRHSSTLNHLYHKKSVWVDKLVNRLCTHIVAISKVTQQVLTDMEGVSESKISLIHHGFDLEAFSEVDDHRVTRLLNNYHLPHGATYIGVCARYTYWKGYQYIIPALGELKKEYPGLHFVFANASGDYQQAIREQLAACLPPGSYTEIRFESDVPAYYKLLDVYIHTPIDKTIEAFGQTYIEALASGVASVFTLSGVANEFVVHEQNALVVPYASSTAIAEAVNRLLQDASLKKQLTANGKQDVKKFNLDTFIDKHLQLYQKKLV